MAIPTWPVTLPSNPQKGYSEDVSLNILRTPTDAGPAKMRLRGLKPSQLKVNYLLTSAQLDILDTFITSTLMGVKRFTYTHPRKGTAVEVRIVPSSEGVYYNASYAAPGYYNINLLLEVLP